MTKEKSLKQFAESVTKWNFKKADEFSTARLKLTFYYSLTAIVILSIASIILYDAILTNFTSSILENVIDPNIAQIIIDKAQDILLNRFITVDAIIMIFIIIIEFFLTHKTLEPIRSNMQKQKRFIADASHELRTPTAVVISGLEVALSNKNLDFSTAKKTLENTLNEMREFSELSNTLLDISKNDSKISNKFESININALINSVVNKDKNLALLKEINIETNLKNDATILGNKIDLERVIYNILDNAIKYTPKRGNITVSDEISKGKYILTISDTGNGIPKDIIDKIFDPFFRGDASRNTEGAGLGLTLSKKIILNYKGTIAINSEENKGTNVIITLPISS